MKVAIFGGSFNPVHKEHVNIVKAAIECLSLDKVIIMPSDITPAKSGRMVASAADRLKTCQIAFAGVPQAEVSDFEINAGGISYSYLTCREFERAYPSDERFFIIGGDRLENFCEWKYPEEILKRVTLAVCAREGVSGFERAKEDFYARFGKRVMEFNFAGKKVSSTRIRARAALGEDSEGCLDDEVEKYILDNSLYSLGFAGRVKESMSGYRWKHTVGVAVMAAENCARYNVPEKSAIIAALLHDCGKEIPPDSPLVANCAVASDVPSPVVHQSIGAYLAENVYGVTDTDILNAVGYHCSGRENMSPLEKLIYLSDMLEEGRTYDGVQRLREIFKRDKDEALYCAVKAQLQRLGEAGAQIYGLTRKAYEYLEERRYDE